MILLTPLALVGLLLLPPLILLHLRRRHYRLEDVPSTLLWREVLEETQRAPRWVRLSSLPLLVLQLLAVTLLVIGLSQPASPTTPSASYGAHVYILDDSTWMSATDLGPTRLVAAKRLVGQAIARDPRNTLVTIVAATAQPYVLISSTDGARARQALAGLAPTMAPADLAGALRLADGLLAQQRGQSAAMTLLRAREDAVPAVTGGTILSTVALGRSTDDQAILHFSARCAGASGRTCEAFAVVRNNADRAVTDPMVVLADGDILTAQPLVLPAHSDSWLSFPVPRGRQTLEMHLSRPDILSADDSAWCVVEGTGREQVTLVGDTTGMARVEAALAGVPGVALRVRTPAHYTTHDATRSDLLILDGWQPAGGLPPARAVLLIDPPTLPGGSVGNPLADATVSGLDSASPLLSDVDLTSLDVPPGTAHQLTVPRALTPVVWTAGGPLLAAGDVGAQRLAVLAFDPAASNLAQLDAFPLLLWNVVRWSAAWLPTALTAGEGTLISAPLGTTSLEIADDGGRIVSQTLFARGAHHIAFTPRWPGLYRVVTRGPWGSRTALVAANVEEQTRAPGSAVILTPAETTATMALDRVRAEPLSWWPWLGLAALLAIVAEWLYVARRGQG